MGQDFLDIVVRLISRSGNLKLFLITLISIPVIEPKDPYLKDTANQA